MKVSKHPKIVILITLLITLFFGFQLPKLIFSNDVEEFLPNGDPAKIAKDRLVDDFGSSEPMVIGYTVKNGDITSKENLEKIDSLTKALEKIDSVSEVTSITNADYVIGDAGGIETSPVVEEIPSTPAEEDEIKEKLTSWDIYKGMLYTPDFKSSAIIVQTEVISQDRGGIIYDELKKATSKYSNDFDFYIAGEPVAYALMATNMRHDLSFLVPLVLLILIGTLFVSFRRTSGVVLPLLTVLISTVITLGLLAMIGLKLTLLGTVIPVLLIAVGSAYGIHFISHYYVDAYNDADKNGQLTEEVHNQILNETLNGVGKGVLLAALTTIVGFGSLSVSKIVPVKVFGIFTALGVLFALIVTMTLIPAILQIKHADKVKPVHDAKGITSILDIFVKILPARVITIIIAVSLITLSVISLPNLKIGSMTINFFKPTTAIRKANDWLQKNSNGSVIINIRFEADGDAVENLADPIFLQEIDSLKVYLKSNFTDVGNVSSIADFVKKINEVVNADEEGNYYEIPKDYKKYGMDSEDQLRPLVSQYLMLFSGDMSDYANDGISPTVTKAVIQIKSDDLQKVETIVDSTRAWLDKNIPDGVSYELSGGGISELAVTNLIVDSQTKSILFSLLAVFVILAVYFRSLGAGVIGMFTLSIPVLLNFGVMSLFKIHLDAATSMIASIAIGIGIDYVIHFMNHYSLDMKEGKSFEEAAINSIKTTGSPILFNAISVALGFLVLAFSQFVPLQVMGEMIALTMITSSLASLTVLPAILITFKPKYLTKNNK